MQFEEHIFQMGGFNHQPTNHPYIITQLAVYTTYILPSGGFICYLPPFRGTRINHWDIPFTQKTSPKPKRGSQPSDKTQVQRLSQAMWLGSERKKSRISYLLGGKSSQDMDLKNYWGCFLVGKNYILCFYHTLTLILRKCARRQIFFCSEWVYVVLLLHFSETYQE